jgi:hypothetical protein
MAREKKITWVKSDPQTEALKALKFDISDGVSKIMELLPALVLNKVQLRQEFQAVLNAIVVEWILTGEVKPTKPRGRPSGKSEEKEIEACNFFWSLRDLEGLNYEEATERTAEQFERNPRQISRYITKHKDMFEPTKEERQRERDWQEVMRKMNIDGTQPLASYMAVIDEAKKMDKQRDYFAEIDAIVAEQLAKVTDIK